MHILLHVLLLFFKYKGKGFWVMPTVFVSTILVFMIYLVVNSILGYAEDRFTSKIILGISLIVAGIANSFVTRNYAINLNGEKEYFEIEGQYIYVNVSDWTKILIVIGVIIIVGNVCDAYNL